MSARSSTTIARGLLLVTALVMLAVSCGQKPAGETLEIRVAAASDLTRAFEEMASAYEKKSGKKLKLTFGSTGQLSKQIIDGAPFEVFAAANVSFVDEVIEKAGCDADTRALYALGRIVVFTKDGGKVTDLAELTDPRFKKIAIANPEHAPYGKAAKEALQSKGVWDQVEKRIVQGENVSQTLQYAETGNADVAIVALSIAMGAKGEYTLIDDKLHQPLNQALVVCAKGDRAAPAKEFAAFVNSPDGREVMKRYGFLLPGEKLSVAAP